MKPTQKNQGSAVPQNRRSFLGRAGAVAAAALQPVLRGPGGKAQAAEVGPLPPDDRRARAYEIRSQMALGDKNLLPPEHAANGDEERFANKIGNFSKGLPHNNLGEPYLDAYGRLMTALTSGRPSDFEAIPMGSADPTRRRKLVNPQSGLAFDLEGMDSHQLGVAAPPAFSSAQQAGEAIELYWMALARDVPFTQYGSDAITRAAAAELSALTDFRGPKVSGAVTTGTLFRGSTPGDLNGPYLSQFLLKTVPYGAEIIDQRIRTLLPGIDYMTRFADWLEIQNGFSPAQPDQFDPTTRHIRAGRDLAQYVHVDVLFQAYFNAALLLMASPEQGGIGAPVDAGNPYATSETQDGFGTFGGPHIATLVAEVATRALKAVWYEKWFVHRRARPEEFGGRITTQ